MKFLTLGLVIRQADRVAGQIRNNIYFTFFDEFWKYSEMAST